MSALSDRFAARAAIASARARGAVMPCIHPETVQALDVRVRDLFKGDVPVRHADVTVTPMAGGAAVATGQTDSSGDVVFRLPVGNYRVSVRKDWHLHDPEVQGNVVVPAYGLRVVTLIIEEVRYYLHVDADRNGSVDDPLPRLNTIVPWQWGARGRGAIVLCNNDHDDGAAPPRPRDNEDNIVNQGNDGTHDVAPLEIRRKGPNKPPAAAANWQATLRILGGRENRIRIFNGTVTNARQLLGAAHGAMPAVAHAVISLRVATVPPTAYPDTALGMEATSYATTGFDGLIRIQLDVTGGGPAYFTAAEVRVAPWMMPNHLDEAQRVYVVNLGNDALDVGGNYIDTGNSSFRAALGAALTAAGINGANSFVQRNGHDSDRWMQDTMEIGYSVLPRAAGGQTRHRIEAVMRTPRDHGANDLKAVPGELLDADFGYHYPGDVAAPQRYADATAGGAGNTGARLASLRDVLESLTTDRISGTPAHLTGWFTVAEAQAARRAYVIGDYPSALAALPADLRGAIVAAVDAAEAQLIADGNANLASMRTAARNAVQALPAPANTLALATYLAQRAARGAEAQSVISSPTNPFNSGGNLECTPPCQAGAGGTGGAKTYPWGRIYFGHGTTRGGFDPATIEFLKKQVVQYPFALDTNWLDVGHVDEMVTFIPASGSRYHRWRALVASPQRAFQLLDGLPPGTPILTGRYWSGNPVNTTVGVLRSGTVHTPFLHAGSPLTGDALRDFNLTTVQTKIDALVARLAEEIGARPRDIIHVPVVFKPGHGDVADALTADMVNMLVVNSHLIVPDPFGPHPGGGTDVFQDDLRSAIRRANPALTVHFVDDWDTYHVKKGEVHCGTNTNRRPANLNAWLGSQQAEWWRFEGP